MAERQRAMTRKAQQEELAEGEAPPPAERQDAPPPAEHVALLTEYETDAEGGFEFADRAAYSVPRLLMLQKLSPQVDKDDHRYIEGAEPGMILNSVTHEIFPRIYVVPCLYRQTWVEWYPRSEGGGFLAEHETPDPKWRREGNAGPYLWQDDKGQETYINDTRNFYILMSGTTDDTGLPVNPQPAVLSLTSTQIRRAMDWMTIMRHKRATRPGGGSFSLPMFAGVYQLTPDYQSNDKGNWYGWGITDTGALVPAGSDLYQQAKHFRDLVASDRVRVEPHEPEPAASPVDDAEAPPF